MHVVFRTIIGIYNYLIMELVTFSSLIEIMYIIKYNIIKYVLKYSLKLKNIISIIIIFY